MLTSRGIALPLKAGAPDSVDVDDEAFQALLDAGDDRGLLTLGKPAPYLCLVVRDEAGTRLESEQLAGLTATLTCADACHTLREAPTDAPIDGSSMTDAEPGALPGGWSVLSGWDAPPEVAEGARGWPIKFRLALAGGDARLETSFELRFRNGPLAEVQAAALPGGVLSVEVGEIFQGDDFFSLKDESGNPFRDDPTADADAPRGPMFDVAIECDTPGLDLELQRVGTKKPKKGKGKKKKAPAADAPEPETAGAVVVPVGAALETLTIPECRVAVAGGELSEVVEAKLVLRARAECPADAAALQLDFIPVRVAPSSKVRTLEIFKEKDQVGAEDGEVPAVGADPEAGASTGCRWRHAGSAHGPERPRRDHALGHVPGRHARDARRGAARELPGRPAVAPGRERPQSQGLEEDRQARPGRPLVVLQAHARRDAAHPLCGHRR